MSTIDYKELWDKICGPGSLLALFADTRGLNELVEGIVISTEEDDQFQAFASFDPDEGNQPLISITTGCYQEIKKTITRGMTALCKDNPFPWIDLGYKKESFADLSPFIDYLSDITLDFIILHELGHIIRGHVEKYVKFNPAGLFEVEENNSEILPGLRRIALELDADSIAIYLMVSLSEFLLENHKKYHYAKDELTFISTIGLAKNILYAILADMTFSKGKQEIKKQKLVEGHQGHSHPHASARQEFSDQRIIQLSTSNEQKALYFTSIERSYEIFLKLVSAEIFDVMSMETWLHDTQELSDFLNILIAEIELASEEGWMNDNTRLHKSIQVMHNPSYDL